MNDIEKTVATELERESAKLFSKDKQNALLIFAQGIDIGFERGYAAGKASVVNDKPRA